MLIHSMGGVNENDLAPRSRRRDGAYGTGDVRSGHELMGIERFRLMQS